MPNTVFVDAVDRSAAARSPRELLSGVVDPQVPTRRVPCVAQHPTPPMTLASVATLAILVLPSWSVSAHHRSGIAPVRVLRPNRSEPFAQPPPHEIAIRGGHRVARNPSRFPGIPCAFGSGQPCSGSAATSEQDSPASSCREWLGRNRETAATSQPPAQLAPGNGPLPGSVAAVPGAACRAVRTFAPGRFVVGWQDQGYRDRVVDVSARIEIEGVSAWRRAL